MSRGCAAGIVLPVLTEPIRDIQSTTVSGSLTPLQPAIQTNTKPVLVRTTANSRLLPRLTQTQVCSCLHILEFADCLPGCARRYQSVTARTLIEDGENRSTARTGMTCKAWVISGLLASNYAGNRSRTASDRPRNKRSSPISSERVPSW